MILGGKSPTPALEAHVPTARQREKTLGGVQEHYQCRGLFPAVKSSAASISHHQRLI